MTTVYKFLFQKLCRDKVKDIFIQKGLTATCKSLDGEAYLQSLKAKIVEEAQEVYNAQNLEELQEEIADLQDVLKTLIKAAKLSPESNDEFASKKRERFGGFETGTYVEAILIPEAHPDLKYYRKYPEKYPEEIA
jgi:predicted house-cleaning noncanonical NTP pyrophosphatase (MazG superfamily)